MNRSKLKGDRAELECAQLINEMLGLEARRLLGAGRREDMGDIWGVPDTVVQVVSRATDVVNVGLVRKPIEVETQRINARATFAATFVRIRGGTWRVVLTPDQFATLWREATG